MNSRLVTVQPSARSAAVADSTIGIGWFATVAIPLQPAALSGACAMCGELSLFSAAKVLLEDSRRILIEGARHRHRPSAALLAYDAGGTRHPRAGSDRQVLDIDIHLAVDTPWRCSPSFAEWSASRLQCIRIHYLDRLRALAGEPKSIFVRTLEHYHRATLRLLRRALTLDHQNGGRPHQYARQEPGQAVACGIRTCASNPSRETAKGPIAPLRWLPRPPVRETGAREPPGATQVLGQIPPSPADHWPGQ